MKSHSINLFAAAVGLTLIGSAHGNTADAKVYDKRVDHVELIEDVMIAQADTNVAKPEVKHRVEVFTSSSPGNSFGPLAMNESFKYSFGNDVDVVISNALSEAFSTHGMRPAGKSIKNAPYSAVVISEKTQSLADGNQITKRSTTVTYRDSAGRTREETRDDSGNVRVIHVYDAVDDSRYVLDPGKKTATKISTSKLKPELMKRLDEARANLNSFRRGTPEKPMGTARTHSQLSISGDSENEPVNVRVISINGETEVNVNGKVTKFNAEKQHAAQLEGMKSMPMFSAFQDRGYAAKSTTRELGSRDFDGIRAEGKMTSYTIPAGEIGNRNPITVSTESWFSPDLQVTVYSKQSDPRYGDTVYRLANIKRNEPAMSLFGVPTDYTLKEAPMKMITSTSTSQSSTSK